MTRMTLLLTRQDVTISVKYRHLHPKGNILTEISAQPVLCFSGVIVVTSSVMAQNNRYAATIKLPQNFWYDDTDIDPVIGIEIEGSEGQRIDLASDVDDVNLVTENNLEFEGRNTRHVNQQYGMCP